ncbi:helix-turn-helix domain-containing protein [Microbacterium sp. P01]|uniref:helix-turn-helix domain-containing protein n=1 Tax=unclassified Microbacterium TaxID=2609290 RepID=UPI003672052C
MSDRAATFPVDGAAVDATAADSNADVGPRLRDLRKQQGFSARQLADALGISPSAVSQIERGVLRPSVSRLIAITDALDVPLAAVFDTRIDIVREIGATAGGFTLQRADHATGVLLDTGVTFRRLAPGRTPGVDYFESMYPVGSTAHADNELFRHDGYEVGTMVSGELTIDFDDERVILRPGDSISYPCSTPHRIHNTGAVAAVARWLIVHPDR